MKGKTGITTESVRKMMAEDVRLRRLEEVDRQTTVREAVRLLKRTARVCPPAWSTLSRTTRLDGYRMAALSNCLKACRTLEGWVDSKGLDPSLRPEIEAYKCAVLARLAEVAEGNGAYDVAVECLEELLADARFAGDVRIGSDLLRLCLASSDLKRTEAIVREWTHSADYGWMRLVAEVLGHGIRRRNELDDAIGRILDCRGRRGMGDLTALAEPNALHDLARHPLADPASARDLHPALGLMRSDPEFCNLVARAIDERLHPVRGHATAEPSAPLPAATDRPPEG